MTSWSDDADPILRDEPPEHADTTTATVPRTASGPSHRLKADRRPGARR
jgi:hypothetical protein